MTRVLRFPARIPSLLVVILTVAGMAVATISITFLYRTALAERKGDLLRVVRRQAALLDAIGRFDQEHSQEDHPDGWEAAAFEKPLRAYQSAHLLGPRESLVLGRMDGERLERLLVLDAAGLRQGESLPRGSARGRGLSLAMKGESGVLEALDSGNHRCLVAYAPVPSLRMGLVMRVEVQDLRAPYLWAGGWAVGLGLAVLFVGGKLVSMAGNRLLGHLAVSEQRLAALTDIAPVGFYETDAQGNNVYSNARWCEVTGMSAEDSSGDGWIKAIHPEDRALVFERWAASTRDQVPFRSEHRILDAQGNERWTLVQSQALQDASGEITGYVGAITDITGLKQAETELKSLEERWKFAIEGTGAGVIDWNIPTGDAHFSPRWYELSGYDPATFPTRLSALRDLVHPEDLPGALADIQDVLEGRKAVHASVHRLRHRSGHWIWVSSRSMVSARDAQGNPVRMIGTHIDITDRVVAEQARRESEARLVESEHRLAEASRIGALGYWELDMATGQYWWSKEQYLLCGMAPGEPITQDTFLAMVHPSDRATFDLAFQRVLAGELVDLEFRIVQPDGGVRHFLGRAEFGGDPDHRPVKVRGTNLDITERKRMEEALRGIQANLEAAQRIAHLGNWTWDIASGRLEWSDEMFRILGHAPHSFQPTYQGLLEQVPREDRPLLEASVSAALEGVRPFHLHHRLRRADGSECVVEAQGEVTRDMEGRPLRMVGTAQDISLQKAAETALQTLNETLEQRVAQRTQELLVERNFISTILETAGSMVVVLDEAGRVLRFNRACEQVTGFRFEEVRGRAVWDVLVPEDEREAVQGGFQNLASQPMATTCMSHWVTREGTRRLIAWANASILGPAGEVIVIATGTDITDQYQAEQELIRAKQHAEQANQAKTEFLSRMSHELRTPLNAILGFAQLLEWDGGRGLTDGQRRQVSEILHAGRHLLELINDVLDLARIEADHLPMSLRPTPAGQVVEDALRLVAPKAGQAGIAIRLQDSVAWPLVLADGLRLKQVLVNLLTNAIHYNRAGGRVMVDIAASGPDRVRLRVSDTGRGIPPEKMDALFIPFERLGAERSGVDGVGIGLALSRKLMEGMGGLIGAESCLGEGSTFWVELPLAPPQEPELKRPVLPRAGSGRALGSRPFVLYVEDNPANAAVVRDALATHGGYDLATAGSSEDALGMLETRTPDILLLDLNLPGLDGYGFLRLLRAREDCHDLPVIALTAEAFPGDVARGIEAGFFAYLTKPVDMYLLLSTLELARPGMG